MDKQFLKLRDFLSILTGLREINKPLGDQEIENVIEKINNLIPPHRKDQIQEYQDQLIIDFLPWGFAPKQEKRIKEIQKAIRNNMTLKIGYRNMKNELTERVVEPMTLVFRGYNWYLFAYCCKKGDYRLFKVNRIKNIKLLFHIFKRRKKSFQDVFAQNDQREKICLKLKYSPDFRYKVEEYFGEKDIQLDDQGNLIVIMSLPEDDWIYSYILGFGDKVEVLEPESIRDIIKDKISKMNRIYP